jgi:uncharacterized protein (TIGR02001 family)
MRKANSILAGLVIGATALTGCASSRNIGQIDATMTNTLKSRYIASGFVINDNPVLQTDVTLSTPQFSGVFANVWGNLDMETNTFSEVDFVIGKTGKLTDDLNYGASISHYDFSFGELGFGAVQKLEAFVNTINAPLDFGAKFEQIFGNGSGHGRIYSLSAGKSFDLTKAFGLGDIVSGGGISLTPRAGVSYNDHFFNGKSGFSHAIGEIGLNADLGKGWSVYSGFYKQFPIDEDKFGDTFSENEVWSFGIAKSISLR